MKFLIAKQHIAHTNDEGEVITNCGEVYPRIPKVRLRVWTYGCVECMDMVLDQRNAFLGDVTIMADVLCDVQERIERGAVTLRRHRRNDRF